MDAVIILLIILMCMLSIIVMDYMFQKLGLKIMFIIMYILSLIMSLKQITLGNISFNLNIIPYVSLISIVYIFIKKYNIKDNIKDLKIICLYTLFIYLSLFLFINYKASISDIISFSLNTFISNNYISLLLFPVITMISIYGTHKLYNIIKNTDNILFVIVAISSIIVGLIDSVFYGTISAITTMSIDLSLKLGLGNYLFRILLSLLFIPMINYVVKRKKESV